MSGAYKLLFICTGNICRSPMAEALARSIGQSQGKTVNARSASTLGLTNRPAHRHSVKVMRWNSINITEHRSQPITKTLIDWADFILVMERKHATHVREHFPEASEKTLELGTFGGYAQIDDPIGKWVWAFRGCRNNISSCLSRFIQQLPHR